jgi:hypothetical protein
MGDKGGVSVTHSIILGITIINMNWFCSCTWHGKVISIEQLPDYVNITVRIDPKSVVMLWYKIESEYYKGIEIGDIISFSGFLIKTDMKLIIRASFTIITKKWIKDTFSDLSTI